jgi:hypothetical protein
MRWPILITAVILSASADGQVRTRCVRTDGVTVDCVTTGTTPPLKSNAEALAAAQRLVPNWREGDEREASLQNMRLQNEMMRRQMERQSAPGYDRKQCRQSAKSAINADDLALARDVLVACAGGR